MTTIWMLFIVCSLKPPVLGKSPIRARQGSSIFVRRKPILDDPNHITCVKLHEYWKSGTKNIWTHLESLTLLNYNILYFSMNFYICMITEKILIKYYSTRKFNFPMGGFFLAPAEGCSFQLQQKDHRAQR